MDTSEKHAVSICMVKSESAYDLIWHKTPEDYHLRNLLPIKISVGMLKLTVIINYSLYYLVVNSCARAPVTKTSVPLNLPHCLDNVCYLDSTEIRLLLFEVSIEWLIIVFSLINISKPTHIQYCN